MCITDILEVHNTTSVQDYQPTVLAASVRANVVSYLQSIEQYTVYFHNTLTFVQLRPGSEETAQHVYLLTNHFFGCVCLCVMWLGSNPMTLVFVQIQATTVTRGNRLQCGLCTWRLLWVRRGIPLRLATFVDRSVFVNISYPTLHTQPCPT